jgi:hypothetical protein
VAETSTNEAAEGSQGGQGDRPSIGALLTTAPWTSLEEHLDGLRSRVDNSVRTARDLRHRYREELLRDDPDLADKILRPSAEALEWATTLLKTGTVAAADGTIAGVPLLGGSKIQVGVVIVSNSGEVVELVTRVFEVELASGASDAKGFFTNLRKTRTVSNLLARAVMALGERKLLLEHPADWRMIHGELVPYELRTGAGNPRANLEPAFDLIYEYLESEKFIAVSESSDDLDILNAAILLEPGEYVVLKTLEDELRGFLEGDEEIGRAAAKFGPQDEKRFREFIQKAGPQVAILLIKGAQRPFFLECHMDHTEKAAALFLADSLWTRGLPLDGSAVAVRAFPYHIDLADRVAGTIFKASDFRSFVEARVMELGVEEGLIDIDPRTTRS